MKTNIIRLLIGLPLIAVMLFSMTSPVLAGPPYELGVDYGDDVGFGSWDDLIRSSGDRFFINFTGTEYEYRKGGGFSSSHGKNDRLLTFVNDEASYTIDVCNPLQAARINANPSVATGGYDLVTFDGGESDFYTALQNTQNGVLTTSIVEKYKTAAKRAENCRGDADISPLNSRSIKFDLELEYSADGRHDEILDGDYRQTQIDYVLHPDRSWAGGNKLNFLLNNIYVYLKRDGARVVDSDGKPVVRKVDTPGTDFDAGESYATERLEWSAPSYPYLETGEYSYGFMCTSFEIRLAGNQGSGGRSNGDRDHNHKGFNIFDGYENGDETDEISLISYLNSAGDLPGAGGNKFRAFKDCIEELQDDGTLDDIADGEEPPATGAENIDNCQAGPGAIAGFLNFIICPIVELVLGAVHWIETNLIIPYLAISPLETEGPDNTIFRLWQVMRNVAYALLIIAFMYLVFAETTSLGGEAYQLKRLAPRLVIAVIAISFSFFLTGLVIDFFNVLGIGIAQIVDWAVGLSGTSAYVVVDPDIGGLVGTGAIGLSAALIAGSVTAGALGVAAITGLLILLAVVVTILVRNVLIIVLVIVSPLAAVATLLPNTEKFSKMWWSYMTKALMMYPLIMLLFAAGKLFGSFMTGISGDDPGRAAITQTVVFLANIAPLVLIPFTFKAAGGAIGSLYGALRGAAGKAQGTLMGSEHDPNSVRNKMRNKGRQSRSEKLSGQRGLVSIPGGRRARNLLTRGANRLPGRAGKIAGGLVSKPLSARAVEAATKTPIVGGMLGSTERLAHIRAEAEKQTEALLKDPTGEQNVKQLIFGGKVRKARDRSESDKDFKPDKRKESEFAGIRGQQQQMLGVIRSAAGKYGVSDEYSRFFAQNLADQVQAGSLSREQAAEQWGAWTDVAKGSNPLLKVAGKDSWETFAQDDTVGGAGNERMTATENADGTISYSSTTGDDGVVAQMLKGDGKMAAELLSKLDNQEVVERASPQSLLGMHSVLMDESSPAFATLLGSAETRKKLKTLKTSLTARASAGAKKAAEDEGGGYGVSGGGTRIGSDIIRRIDELEKAGRL